MTNDNPRSRRSLRNIRFMKGSRLRLVFSLVTAGMILSVGMLAAVVGDVDRELSRIPLQDPLLLNLMNEIRSNITFMLMLGLVLNGICTLLALCFGLLVSHVFYGPQVALLRHLRELKEGNFGARARLRPGDELADLMTEQNALAESLESKFGEK